ncbi:hypothetical protein MSAN_02277200 [Mycena sanguinolenta]|uniref:Uncharacterized protein n=1 Tax=Mycena sanguinolenta TaxID=230812 RepID=A0A8H6XA43_9AGAR|nr:hypothetical protein MSAN_02277200 [Mycena sanguinolenta]
MQLYGLASTKGLYAIVFYDELIPYAQFLCRFEHLPIVRAYIIGYCGTEFNEAANYISDIFRKPLINSFSLAWIRSGTGELCLDLTPGRFNRLWGQSRWGSRRTCGLELELQLSIWLYKMQKAWLAQANIIFTELEEEAHVKDYVCVNEVRFILRIIDKHHIPEGYLFVCPVQDFRIATKPQLHSYQWPDCPAYWSLDPSGADRLSIEHAKSLGFPTIHIETILSGRSWDRNVYKGLQRFHQGKGFDPDNQEVARQLGYPLYEVLSDCVLLPAHEINHPPLWCEQPDPAFCQSLGHSL